MICIVDNGDDQWRAEGGAMAPGIQAGGIQRGSFLKKSVGKINAKK